MENRLQNLAITIDKINIFLRHQPEDARKVRHATSFQFRGGCAQPDSAILCSHSSVCKCSSVGALLAMLSGLKAVQCPGWHPTAIPQTSPSGGLLLSVRPSFTLLPCVQEAPLIVLGEEEVLAALWSGPDSVQHRAKLAILTHFREAGRSKGASLSPEEVCCSHTMMFLWSVSDGLRCSRQLCPSSDTSADPEYFGMNWRKQDIIFR